MRGIPTPTAKPMLHDEHAKLARQEAGKGWLGSSREQRIATAQVHATLAVYELLKERLEPKPFD